MQPVKLHHTDLRGRLSVVLADGTLWQRVRNEAQGMTFDWIKLNIDALPARIDALDSDHQGLLNVRCAGELWQEQPRPPAQHWHTARRWERLDGPAEDRVA